MFMIVGVDISMYDEFDEWWRLELPHMWLKNYVHCPYFFSVTSIPWKFIDPPIIKT